MPFFSIDGIDYALQHFVSLQVGGLINGSLARKIAEKIAGTKFVELKEQFNEYITCDPLYGISTNLQRVDTLFYQQNYTGDSFNALVYWLKQFKAEVDALPECEPPENVQFDEVVASTDGQVFQGPIGGGSGGSSANDRGFTLTGPEIIASSDLPDTRVAEIQEVTEEVRRLSLDSNEDVPREYYLPRYTWVLDTEFNIQMRNRTNTLDPHKTKQVRFWVNPANVSLDFQMSMEETQVVGGILNTFWSNPLYQVQNQNENYFLKCVITFPFETGNILPEPFNTATDKNTVPPGLRQLYQVMYMFNQPRQFRLDNTLYNNHYYLQISMRSLPNILFLGQFQSGLNITEDINNGFHVNVPLTFHAYASTPAWHEWLGTRYLEELQNYTIKAASD